MSGPSKTPRNSPSSKRKASNAIASFEQTYPSIAKWVKSYGWIEVGQVDWYRESLVRALDEGGIVWEGKLEYATLDDLWRDLEAGLAEWFNKNG